MWKTGHSLIKSKMKETGSPLAGEMSGHVFFKHDYYGFDDAPYAAIRLIQAATNIGKSVTQLRSDMVAMINTPEMRFQVDESRKFPKYWRGFRPAARKSMTPTVRGSIPKMAGGCSAPATPRMCWSRGPKPSRMTGSTG